MEWTRLHTSSFKRVKERKGSSRSSSSSRDKESKNIYSSKKKQSVSSENSPERNTEAGFIEEKKELPISSSSSPAALNLTATAAVEISNSPAKKIKNGRKKKKENKRIVMIGLPLMACELCERERRRSGSNTRAHGPTGRDRIRLQQQQTNKQKGGGEFGAYSFHDVQDDRHTTLNKMSAPFPPPLRLFIYFVVMDLCLFRRYMQSSHTDVLLFFARLY